MGSLVLSNVARSFGDVVAVRDVSFTVPAGSTFGLLGPNGAGKTTTMRMILGILVPDRGTVRWDGAPVDGRGAAPLRLPARGARALRQAQGARADRLLRPPARRPARRSTRAAPTQWIERLGLGEYADRPCAELSKGNQQKVQIACAALHEPELLVLDEPFSGLDPLNAEVLLDALRALRAAGTTLILSSHQMWQIEDLCERFCVIAGGVVRAAGTLAELRAAWPTRVVEVEPAADALRAVLAAAARRARAAAVRAAGAGLRGAGRRRHRGAAAAAGRGRRRDPLRAARAEPARHLPARDGGGGVNAIGIVFSAEFLRRIVSRPYIFATLIGAASIVLHHAAAQAVRRRLRRQLERARAGRRPGADRGRRAAARSATTRSPRRCRGSSARPTRPSWTRTARRPRWPCSRAAASGLRVTAYARDPSDFGRAFAPRSRCRCRSRCGPGVPVATVAAATSTVPVDVHDVAGRFADASAAGAAKGIGYLFVFLLYLAILLNAQAIMASVAEEKTSRIAELLVATIDPAQLLTAKILASAATGMIQLAVWVATGALAGSAVVGMFSDAAPARAAGSGIGPLALPPGEVLSFVAFFIVGFLQYGVLYAAAASLINRTEDLGSVTGPLVVPVVIGFVLAQLTLQFPNSPNLVVCSQIPLLAPFVMFTRIAVSAVPAWQIVLSLVDQPGRGGVLRLGGGQDLPGRAAALRPPALAQAGRRDAARLARPPSRRCSRRERERVRLRLRDRAHAGRVPVPAPTG